MKSPPGKRRAKELTLIPPSVAPPSWKATLRDKVVRILAVTGTGPGPAKREAVIRAALAVGESLADDSGRFVRPVYFATLNFNSRKVGEIEAFNRLERFRAALDRELLGPRWAKKAAQRTRFILPIFERGARFGHIHAFILVADSTRAGDFAAIAKPLFRKLFPFGSLFLGGADAGRKDQPLRSLSEFAPVVSYVTKQATSTPLVQ